MQTKRSGNNYDRFSISIFFIHFVVLNEYFSHFSLFRNRFYIACFMLTHSFYSLFFSPYERNTSAHKVCKCFLCVFVFTCGDVGFGGGVYAMLNWMFAYNLLNWICCLTAFLSHLHPSKCTFVCMSSMFELPIKWKCNCKWSIHFGSSARSYGNDIILLSGFTRETLLLHTHCHIDTITDTLKCTTTHLNCEKLTHIFHIVNSKKCTFSISSDFNRSLFKCNFNVSKSLC